MAVVVITQPEPVVTVLEAKAHLRLEADITDEDEIVEAMVAAATANLDGPGGWLGRALGAQTLELRTDRFYDCRDPYFRLPLPFPPLIGVVSVKYDDPDGAEQTLDPGVYTVSSDSIRLAQNQSFPAFLRGPESVRVLYTAGYDILPAPIRAAILLMVGDLYENREAQMVAAGALAIVENNTLRTLLAPFRVHGV
jgi:uncharacterized phiE125 gp8 family phage protein